MTQRDDSQLMAQLAQGDLQALGELVKRHQARARALAYRFTGRWDAADDIAQDAFLRIHRAAVSYRPTADFSTWLYRIVWNLCLDRAKRPRLVGLDESSDPAATPDPDQLEQEEQTKIVQQAVQSLPERQRMVVLLHRFEGLPIRRIAAVMETTESAVESLLTRSYQQLRVKLANLK